MPRIPAAIAVVMLVATCIGLNTARFPVVFEMAAVSAPASPDDSAETSDDSGENRQSGTKSDPKSGPANKGNSTGQSNGAKRESWHSSPKAPSSYAVTGKGGSAKAAESKPWSKPANQKSSGSAGQHAGGDQKRPSGGKMPPKPPTSGDKSTMPNRNNAPPRINERRVVASMDVKPKPDDKERRPRWNDSDDDFSDLYADHDPYGTSKASDDAEDPYDFDTLYGSGSSDDRSSDADQRPSPYSKVGGTSPKKAPAKPSTSPSPYARTYQGGSYGAKSSFGGREEDESITRYDVALETAADDSKDRGSRAPKSESPSERNAYGSGTPASSAAVSSDVDLDHSDLGLVPVEEEPHESTVWGQYDSPQTERSYANAAPREPKSASPGLRRLPKVDPTVLPPTLDPGAPLYPSTGVF